jgi:hypothetical protein
LDIFGQELAGAALLSIGSEREKSAFYMRVVELSLERGGQRLKTPGRPAQLSLSKAAEIAQ